MKQILRTTVCIVILLGTGLCKAQSYLTTFGIRAGSDYGITLQQRIFKSKLTLEGILQTSKYKYSATVMLQQHRRMIGKRINFYYGIGGHTGNDKAFGKFYGISPIVGAELTLARLNFSIDYKPAINIVGHDWAHHDSAFSIRYVLIKQPKKEWRKKLFNRKK
ncbi:MAG: hypothetical protein IPO27_18785 [Bacteroidetes bacterium]|nr:hypothetical protein [Bacteroidota bacterium]